MEEITLAGGLCTHLYLLVLVTSTQLLPICDKQIIHYPLSILMLVDILIISSHSVIAVTLLPFFSIGISSLAKLINHSHNIDFETNSLTYFYLEKRNIYVTLFEICYSWLNITAHKSLSDTSNFIKIVGNHYELKICCLEEIIYKDDKIANNDWRVNSEFIKINEYNQHLIKSTKSKII